MWLYAAHKPRVAAGVAWYGGPLVEAGTALRPLHPIDVVARLDVPVLGLYGGADAIIPLPSIEQMQDALARRGGASRIEVFPGAPHAFHAQNRPNYRAEPAERGWALMLDWFARHL